MIPRRPALLLAGLLSMTPSLAEMDVDQADSLNFHGFHKDKKAAIKIWEDGEKGTTRNDSQPTKAYEVKGTAPVASQPAASTLPAATTDDSDAGETRGKRYEIRERYTLSRSATTPYSAFYVIEALHQQMTSLCPAGWHKIAERSEAVEGDFYLYYELECL